MPELLRLHFIATLMAGVMMSEGQSRVDKLTKSHAGSYHKRAAEMTWPRNRAFLTIPSEVRGEDISGRRIWFETNVDNYGEVYVDGKIDRVNWVITGNNVGKRIQIEDRAVPGTEHVIAVLVCNAPLAEPVGTIFMRYATLAIE
jgi:hypothetical protein